MEIKIRVGSFNDDEVVKRKQNIEYETFDIKKYKEMFQQLVEDNYIHGSFDHVRWELPYEIYDYPVTLSYDVEIYPKLNLALKAYSVVRMMSGRSPMTIYNELIVTKKAILASYGFKDINKFESMLVNQCSISSYQGYQIATDVKRFLSFYKADNHLEIVEICESIPSYRETSRDLPLFEDIMIFDDIVNNYFRKYPTDETVQFLPIMMWWILTNVLPMRPSEFLLLEKNCLVEKGSECSPYRITVPRIKNESDSPEFMIRYDTVEIDQNTFNIISQAIQQIEYLGIYSDLLFPVDLLTIFRKKHGNQKKKNKRINLRDFDSLKKKFYEKVAEDTFGQFDLERIKSGDTRHFAIINMCLQGFNMLSIARMAGHEEIGSQYSYYSHAEHFAQSYVYRLAQKKLENKVSKNMSTGIIGWKRYIYDKGKSTTPTNEENIVGRVEYGICQERIEVFPNSCIEYCEFCPNYVFNPPVNETTEAIEWLSSSSKTLEVNIRESIEIMKDISTNLANSLQNANNDVLESTSRKLLTYMDMKATIDSMIMEAGAFDKEQKH